MIDVSCQIDAIKVAIEEAAGLISAPHVRMRPSIYPDGNAWCCLYGDDLATGVAGFGETPFAACAEFDRAWDSLRLHANRRSEPRSVEA